MKSDFKFTVIIMVTVLGMLCTGCSIPAHQDEFPTNPDYQASNNTIVVGTANEAGSVLTLSQEECKSIFLRYIDETITEVQLLSHDDGYFLEGKLSHGRFYIPLLHDASNQRLIANNGDANGFYCSGTCDCRKNSDGTDCICVGNTTGSCEKSNVSPI